MTELEWAKRIVAGRPHPTILELGAHHGNETAEIYAAANKPLYIAVEADPRNIPPLVQRLAGARVHVVHAAIADFSGEIDLHLCDGNANASSSIREPKEHLRCFPNIGFSTIVRVPALALDDLATMYGLGDIDLIWCDIQGAEKDMVRGGTRTLPRTRYLLAECDRIEMYAGQATRDQLLAMLPGWALLAEWRENANLLLQNTRL